MRWSARHECAAMVTVLAIPLAIGFVFPLASVGFRAAEDRPRSRAGAAFVVLTERQEAAALAAAKASWQGDAGVRRLRANLSVGALPDEVVRPVLAVRESPARTVKPVGYAPGAYVPSSAAARPKRIAADEPQAKVPAFARAEFLKMEE